MKIAARQLGTLIMLGFLLMPLPGADAQAEFRPGATLLIFDAGYSIGTNRATDEKLDGWGPTLSLEKVDKDGKYSLGFSVARIAYETDVDTSSASEFDAYSVETTPFVITGKGYFGSGSRAKFYAGLGMGVYSAKVNRYKGSQWSPESFGGVAIEVPVGGYIYASESIFLNLGYTFNWLSNSPMKSNMAHTFRLGIGFQL